MYAFLSHIIIKNFNNIINYNVIILLYCNKILEAPKPILIPIDEGNSIDDSSLKGFKY